VHELLGVAGAGGGGNFAAFNPATGSTIWQGGTNGNVQAIGVVGGIMVGMTSVGSGSLMIVLLLFAYPMIGAKQLVGTDLTQAVPLTLAAALGAILFGHVEFSLRRDRAKQLIDPATAVATVIEQVKAGRAQKQ